MSKKPDDAIPYGHIRSQVDKLAQAGDKYAISVRDLGGPRGWVYPKQVNEIRRRYADAIGSNTKYLRG